MIQPTLLFGARLSAVSAGIYYDIGRVLSGRRSASTDARLARVLFVVWWYALAATTLSSAVLSLSGALGIAGLALFSTFTLVNLLASCVALYCLMFYLLYLFTGNRSLSGPLTLSYILLVYHIQASSPTGVTVARGRATLEYQNRISRPR